MNGRDVLVCAAEGPWRDVLMAQVHQGEAYTWHEPHGPLTHWAPLNMPLSEAEARGKAIAASAMRPIGALADE